ncbi:tRNA adenosine(34) deaminase TadA [Buchnera aphidicola (Formosaphis micheliae)]|uniref:tRNA adenosine(34) deaminase TadA n=1 Tax=Buchnera aphidicola TaxID=9 RepID=UPI0031B7F691
MYINHKYWMRCALKLAYCAQKNGEVPVGAILIFNNKVIGEGYNSSISKNDPTAHAEIIALRAGGRKLKNYRLMNTTLYVTKEPCIMCIGAILNSRIYQLVLGSQVNNKYSILNILKKQNITNHKLYIKQKILEKECNNILYHFFKDKRKT